MGPLPIMPIMPISCLLAYVQRATTCKGQAHHKPRGTGAPRMPRGTGAPRMPKGCLEENMKGILGDASGMPPGNRDSRGTMDTTATGPLSQNKLEPLKAKPNWGKIHEMPERVRTRCGGFLEHT